jgi:hypothetical protein
MKKELRDRFASYRAGKSIKGTETEKNLLKAFDLPLKKWTQRRVGISMNTSSRSGGVQWQEKKANGSDLTGNSRFQRSRWSQRVAIKGRKWPGVSGFIRISFITGSRSSVTRERRLFPAKVI